MATFKKRNLSVLLASVLLFGLAACSSSKKPGGAAGKKC